MLNGWKAIAAYLNREERTAMRWASGRGLPVHRAPGAGRGSVYALPSEIDQWLAAGRQTPAFAQSPSPLAQPSSSASAELPAHRLHSLRRWLVPGLLVSTLSVLLGVGGIIRDSSVSARPLAADVEMTDPGVRAAFLQASYDWNLRTRDSLTRAAREFGDVIIRDPRATAAYVGLANSYLLMREDGAMSDAAAYPRAEAAARAALALSPTSAAAHRALAFIAFWWHQDRTGAQREFARSLTLGPNDALTHHWLATALSANGEHEAALLEIVQARELDPGATSIVADNGLLAYLAGRHTEGIRMLRAVERDEPRAVEPHRALADLAMSEGQTGESLREQAILAHLRGDEAAEQAVGRLLLLAPQSQAVQSEMLRNARALVATTGVGWFQLARIAALAGRGDEAAAALAHACQGHEPAAMAAPGDVWLTQTLALARIRSICSVSSLG